MKAKPLRSVRAAFASRLLASSALLLPLAIAAAALPAAAESGAVRCGKLLDVRSGKVLADQVVIFADGKITAVGPSASNALPAGITPMDLSRATCLPGLIDAHTHLTYEPGDTGFRGLGISVPRATVTGVKNARLTLRAGFTTARNVHAGGFSDVAVRDGINAGDIEGPRLLVSGPALGITGGHSDNNLLPAEYDHQSAGVADGVDAVTAKVRWDIKYGADVIKFMATGGVLSEGDNPQAAQYSLAEMRAIVETAHSLGRRVAAHAHGALGIKNAVLAGVDSVEHGSYIDEEGIKLMKQHGTYLVATLYLGDWLLDNLGKLGLTAGMAAKARAVIPEARKNVARAFQEGVKVAFGTDSGVYPHGLNAREFAVMVKLGLTPLQAIQAATVNAADLLGWSDRVGTLEPGRYADLIAVDGDPLADVRVLESVKLVMKGGAIFRNDF
ncbi:MAG TPA: amidohydrolase family protein [Thermoanaerobaculia bacterium]|nr:amidohydrolase family protein [Thermoanaerobaculia bacterium]